MMLEHDAHVNRTRPDDLDSKAEPKGDKVGKVGVDWGWK